MSQEQLPIESDEELSRAERTARLQKLQLENEISALKISKQKREEMEEIRISNNLSNRYWYVPSLGHILQSIAAGIVLSGAFFFLYEPLVDTIRQISKKESKIATLDARIQLKENELLKQENKITSEQNRISSERIKKENEQIKAELKQLIADSELIEKERRKAAEEAKKEAEKKNLELSNLIAEYNKLSEQLNDSLQEKLLFHKLAKDAQEQKDTLANQINILNESANEAENRSKKLQLTLNTRLIRDLPILIFSIPENKNLAEKISAQLREVGASIEEDFSKKVSSNNKSFASNMLVYSSKANKDAMLQVFEYVKGSVELTVNEETDLDDTSHDKKAVIRLYAPL